MRRQSLHFDNLGEVLAAAKNGARFGQQQFETPPDIATTLMLPLPSVRPLICDLQCGHGALLKAGRNSTSETLLGLDIDPTATTNDEPPIIADLQRVAPLLREVQWQCDLFVLNPPFGLRWADGDSTLVTWQLANEFLTAAGEGMMICNASTAERLILSTPEARRIWLKVTLPNFFPGTMSDMRIAVLYFAAGHRASDPDSAPWVDFAIPSAHPEAISEALAQFTHARRRIIRGDTIRSRYDSRANHTASAWRAVAEEWRRLRDEEAGQRQGWNVRLDSDGRLNVWLTPFQQISGRVPRALVEELQTLHRHHPSALVVQKASRLALQRAVSGNIWRVDSEVPKAVAAAVAAYHAVRAPFTPLNAVQRLAYLDEEDSILCSSHGITGFVPGESYPLITETFEGKKIEQRVRGGEHFSGIEDILVTGWELAIIVSDSRGEKHCFVQFPLTPVAEASHEAKCKSIYNEDAISSADHHHSLSELLAHFSIPDIADVSMIDPAKFQKHREGLLNLVCMPI